MSNFKLLKVTSNSVDLQWENIGPDCLYQITRAEVEVLKFDIVYEGRELGIHLENLKPLTKYKFILRTSDSAEHIVWKHDAQEIQVHTQDETLVSKAIIQLLRSIQDCDSVRVASILTEFGNQIPIDTTDKSGRTLLMLACQQGDLEIVKVLVQHGANTSSATLAGKTPVSIAISAGHFPVIQFLLDNDPSLIQSTDTSGTTLLMLAAETAGICFKKGYSTSIIDYLIKKGLDINAQDKHGHTALDRLMMTSGHYEAAQVLIKNGAKIIDKVEKKHGMTTLMMAALNGHTEVVKLLMHQYQQDPRVVNEHGRSAIVLAESGGHKHTVNAIQFRLHELASE